MIQRIFLVTTQPNCRGSVQSGYNRRINEMREVVVRQETRIQALEDQQSKNSGKPPSSDGLKKAKTQSQPAGKVADRKDIEV
jgi:hypothetical protein